MQPGFAPDRHTLGFNCEDLLLISIYLQEMESSRLAVAVAYVIMLIFVYFGVASAADAMAPTPVPEKGAASMAVASSFLTAVISFLAFILF